MLNTVVRHPAWLGTCIPGAGETTAKPCRQRAHPVVNRPDERVTQRLRPSTRLADRSPQRQPHPEARRNPFDSSRRLPDTIPRQPPSWRWRGSWPNEQNRGLPRSRSTSRPLSRHSSRTPVVLLPNRQPSIIRATAPIGARHSKQMRHGCPTSEAEAQQREQRYGPQPVIDPITRKAGQNHLERHDHDSRRPLVCFGCGRTVVRRDRHQYRATFAFGRGSESGHQP